MPSCRVLNGRPDVVLCGLAVRWRLPFSSACLWSFLTFHRCYNNWAFAILLLPVHLLLILSLSCIFSCFGYNHYDFIVIWYDSLGFFKLTPWFDFQNECIFINLNVWSAIDSLAFLSRLFCRLIAFLMMSCMGMHTSLPVWLGVFFSELISCLVQTSYQVNFVLWLAIIRQPNRLLVLPSFLLGLIPLIPIVLLCWQFSIGVLTILSSCIKQIRCCRLALQSICRTKPTLQILLFGLAERYYCLVVDLKSELSYHTGRPILTSKVNICLFFK